MTVTPPKPIDELGTAADLLCRSAPRTWAEFVAAMEKVTSQHQLACCTAPADKILVQQGRAQACAELLTLFKSTPKQK